jgi:hypothetical protein
VHWFIERLRISNVEMEKSSCLSINLIRFRIRIFCILEDLDFECQDSKSFYEVVHPWQSLDGGKTYERVIRIISRLRTQ